MGGIGKTALSVKLANEVQENFGHIIWRSLRSVPPVQEMLLNLIRFVSDEQEKDLPETVDALITLLIYYLREHRCLVVVKLSNVRKGKCIKTFQGHTKWIWSVVFSPDGQILASGSEDETIQFCFGR